MTSDVTGTDRTNEAGLGTVYEPETEARLRADAAEIVSRYPDARSALLPMLHLIQSEDAFVSPRGIALCADILDLSRAEVSAVATFYSQYKRHPNGCYTVGVCTNTLCAVMGGDAIYERLSEHLGVGHDETTADGRITLERLECNAACDFAPVVMVNWEFFDNQTPASAVAIADAITAGEPITPTRGPDAVADFKSVSRVLAGFEDGLVDQGVAARGPTLEGLRLARAKGWVAPSFDADQGEPEPPLEADTPEPPTVGGAQSSATHAVATGSEAAGERKDAPADDRPDAGTTTGSSTGEGTP